MRLRSLIGEIGAKYDRHLPMSSEAQTLLRQARVEFEQWIPVGYRVEGGGRGRAPATPRIAVLAADQTTRSGLYLAYVFAADMSTVTLSLNQGINEIAEHLGRARARRTVAWAAADIRATFRRKEISDLDATFDLGSTAPLALDYQRGNILSRTYRLGALPNERRMVADLQRFIRLYAMALGTRGRGGQVANQVRVVPARDRADPRKVAKPKKTATEPKKTAPEPKKTTARAKPKTTRPRRKGDEHGQRPGRWVRQTKLMTRRSVIVALAAVPAAFVAPATLGLEFIQEQKRPSPPDLAPRFTIDVSQHDWDRRGGNLDWEAVRKAGIAGMCARATYGDPSGFNYPSYHFGDFLRGAKAAGFLLRGGYHNLVRGDQASINRQVDWLRRAVDASDATWAMLDIERYPELVSANVWPRWDDVRRFDDRWAAVEDRILVGYLPPWNWSMHLGRPDLRPFRGPLIASDYPLNNSADEYRRLYARCGGDKGRGWTPYGNRVCDGWQFSSDARVPGAASACGINAWRMTLQQLTALLTEAP